MFTIAFGVVIAVVILSALPGILMTVALLIGTLISLPRAIFDTIKGK